MTETVQLDGLRNLTQVLSRLPQGSAALALMQRLGLWSQRLHENASSPTGSLSNISTWSDEQLSDKYGALLSELHRTTELVGLLEGQKQLLTLSGKSARASARSRLRRAHEALMVDDLKLKALSVGALGDEAEAAEAVQEVDLLVGTLGVVMESAKAYKEACTTTTAGLSREISFRQAQLSARMRV